ncbi:MAG: ABC transporter permease [Gemmatimonadetes bacterium]|nr:ABC transporter permease [Gemmatimonadota bacterium]
MSRLRLGITLVSLLAIVAIIAPLIAPYDPTVQLDLATLRNAAPSFAHPLGTDLYSRDLLSRLLYGARISLLIGLLAVAISVSVGTSVGLVAGFSGGVIDIVLMRIVDAGLAIPKIFILLVVLALWEDVTVAVLIGILGFTGWFGVSRIARAEVLSAREREYVAAARALGAGPIRLIARHILPNIAAPIIVAATLGVGQVILVEAGLSYLGVGVPPPQPSWGNIIRDGQDLIRTAPWISTTAGLAIVLTVVAFSILGDGVRELLDPRER